jgi:hypothetical protein
LRRYGGVYVAPGVECCGSVEPLLRGKNSFAILDDARLVTTAVFGCVPAHPVFARAAREAPRALSLGGGPADANASYFLSLILEQEGGVSILPAAGFPVASTGRLGSPTERFPQRAHGLRRYPGGGGNGAV